MASAGDDVKPELLRVRKEMAIIDEQVEKVNQELLEAIELNFKEKVDDARVARNTLWKEKEHLREQETLFLKALFGEGPLPSIPQLMVNNSNFVQGPTNLVPLLPKPPVSSKPQLEYQPSPRRGRRKELSLSAHQSIHLMLTPGILGDPHGTDLLTFDPEVNESGFEVNRSSHCKIIDVWREWKEGFNGVPAIEKLEEARRRDKKMTWWRHKNDYKYWSKQMRIIHAVERKALELNNDVDSSILFWEDILRVEFEGSISKLREALGADRENKETGLYEASSSKRQRKDLLQHGIDRLKALEYSTSVVKYDWPALSDCLQER